MRIIRKAFVIAGLLWITSLGFTATTYAMDCQGCEMTADPLWSHIAGISANMQIVNGRVTMTGFAMGNAGATHVIGNIVLDRINPNGTATRVASFNNIRANGSVWSVDRVHNVPRGHDYRVTVTVTVFRNGASETASISSRVARAH